jgi:hypothetical protein
MSTSYIDIIKNIDELIRPYLLLEKFFKKEDTGMKFR